MLAAAGQARYINLINTNTQSRRALFNNGDNPPPFNSRSRSKITECRILSGRVKRSHGGGGAEGLKYTFREHIYPKLLLYSKGAMTKQACVRLDELSRLHRQSGEVRIFRPERWHLDRSHEATFCSRSCTTGRSKYALMSLARGQRDGPLLWF